MGSLWNLRHPFLQAYGCLPWPLVFAFKLLVSLCDITAVMLGVVPKGRRFALKYIARYSVSSDTIAMGSLD